MGIAKLFEEQGKHRLAANMYSKVLQSQPDHAEAQQRLVAVRGELNLPTTPTPVMVAEASQLAPKKTAEPTVQLTAQAEDSADAENSGPEIASADLEIDAPELDAPTLEENPFEFAGNGEPLPTADSDAFELPIIDPANGSISAPAMPTSATAGLIEKLSSDDAGERLIAAFDLGEMGSSASEAVPKLNELIESEEDAMVRVLLAEAVAKIHVGDEAALGILRASLDVEDDEVQQLAVLAVSDVIENLNDSEADHASESLKSFAPQVKPALKKAMTHDASIVREAAESGFGIIDQE